MEILPFGRVHAVTQVQCEMLSSGLPGPWCIGLVHRWTGVVEMSGYTFDSNPADPLEFTVTENGFAHSGGSGTVMTPEGRVITLP